MVQEHDGARVYPGCVSLMWIGDSDQPRATQNITGWPKSRAKDDLLILIYEFNPLMADSNL